MTNATQALALSEVPDYYSEQYNYERYPAKVNGRAGHFAVWSDEDVAKTYATGQMHKVTWSPELVALVAKEYQNAAWHAEREEKAARPDVTIGDTVQLGDLVVEVPRRAAEYVDSVPCPVVPATHLFLVNVQTDFPHAVKDLLAEALTKSEYAGQFNVALNEGSGK